MDKIAVIVDTNYKPPKGISSLNSEDLFMTEQYAELFDLTRSRIVQIHQKNDLDHVVLCGKRFFINSVRNAEIIQFTPKGTKNK